MGVDSKTRHRVAAPVVADPGTKVLAPKHKKKKVKRRNVIKLLVGIIVGLMGWSIVTIKFYQLLMGTVSKESTEKRSFLRFERVSVDKETEAETPKPLFELEDEEEEESTIRHFDIIEEKQIVQEAHDDDDEEEDHEWSWRSEEVEEALELETKGFHALGAGKKLEIFEDSFSVHHDDFTVDESLLFSMLQLLEKQVNWSNKEGRSKKRPKEAVVIGTKQIIKRDLNVIMQAYEKLGVKVEQASELSAAVARGRMDGNLRSVRSREWGVILCLSLKTEKCLSTREFGRLESEKLEYSRINRIASLQEVLWSKDQYCKTVQRSGQWLAAYTFPCWVLPDDESKLNDQLNRLEHKGVNPGSWIVKPYKQGGGKGIFVLDNMQEVFSLINEQRRVVLQPYLANPHLLDGRKWDLRTYVLVTSVTPVARGYIFRDGLVRLAFDRYDPNARHGGNKTQFLTNTSVNKKKEKDMSQLTRSFGMLEGQLGTTNFQILFSRIRRAVGMLLVNSELAFAKQYEKLHSDFSCGNCYHLLGIDLIVDANLFPRVIEVNGEPSMQLSGESQSHYDSTKHQMQEEVAKIVLQPVRDIAEKTMDTLKGANLSVEQVRWITKHEKVMLYLMQTKREFQQLKDFEPVYPDLGICDNPGRQSLWDRFIADLIRSVGNNETFHGSPGMTFDVNDRDMMHDIVRKFVCY